MESMNYAALLSLPVLVAIGLTILLVAEFCVQRSKMSERAKSGLSYTFFLIALILAALTVWNEYQDISTGAPRHLTTTQIEIIKEAAKTRCKYINNVFVIYNLYGRETREYAADFKTAFQDTGCEIEFSKAVLGGINPALLGVHIGIRNKILTAQMQRFIEILLMAEVDFYISKMSDDFYPDKKLILAIGTKP